MAINIGDAILFITGDSTGLDKALKSAEGTAQSSMGNIGSAVTKAGALLGGIGATIMGGLGVAIKGFADYSEEIDTASKKTGMSTDAVQEFKHAAEQSSATLDDVTKAVGFMNKNLVQSPDSFAAIGLGADKLKAMRPEDAFTQVLNALTKVPTQADRTAIAMQIFGKGAQALAPLLAEGAQGIQGMRDEAHSLGLVMDKEAITAGEAFGDQMDKMGKILAPLGADIAKTLMPVVQDLAQKILDASASVRTFIADHPGLSKMLIEGAALFGALAVVMGTIMAPLGMIISTVSTMAGAMGAASAAAGGAGLAGAMGALIALLTGPVGLAAVVMAAAFSLWKYFDALKAAVDAQHELEAVNRQVSSTLETEIGVFRQHGIALDEEKIKTLDSGKAVDLLTQWYKAHTDAVKTGSQDKIAAVDAAYRAQIDAASGEAQALQQSAQNYDSWAYRLGQAIRSVIDWLWGLFSTQQKVQGGPNTPGYALGGRVTGPGQFRQIVAGEEGPELATFPGGRTALLAGGMYNVPTGTYINTAAETAAKLASASHATPARNTNITINVSMTGSASNAADVDRISRAIASRVKLATVGATA